jgi:hypothetical protein
MFIVRMRLIKESFWMKSLRVDPIVRRVLNVLEINANDALQSHYYRNSSVLRLVGVLCKRMALHD